jgi:hypothetical protein
MNSRGTKHVSVYEFRIMRNVTEGCAKLILTGSVAVLLPRRPSFDPRPVHLGFVVDKVALGHVSFRVLRFPPVTVVPPMFHTRLLVTDIVASNLGCTLNCQYSCMMHRSATGATILQHATHL